MGVITNDPEKVFEFFEEISAIPRGSGNEKGVSDFLTAFAKKRGLWVRQDEANNVIIKKEASKGYENIDPVIIQGHMDMVCEKNSDNSHDFNKDGIKVILDDGYIRADGTTLGADNGIAVAMAMALLNSKDIAHPRLEILITTNEETGMDGAKAVDAALFDGRRLINLDNEDETIIFASCAGGLRCDISLPVVYERAKPGVSAYNIFIYGLKGGHSGMAIHLQRGNAIRLLARLLSELDKDFDFDLYAIGGGPKENAIPREASCGIVVNDGADGGLAKRIDAIARKFAGELSGIDPDLKIEIKKTALPDKVISKEAARKIITIGTLLPNGVQTMSAEIPGLVESSANIGILRIDGSRAEYCCSLRSSVSSLKYFYAEQIKSIACLAGAEFADRGDYPAWEYEKNSPLRELFINTYRELYNKEAKISAIHAGLECGVFSEKLPGVDMVSVGPDMYDVHTPRERLSVASTLRVWELLKAVLAGTIKQGCCE